MSYPHERRSLYTEAGERKYLNARERRAFIDALASIALGRRLFVLVMYWTGARPSEVINLSARSFQLEAGIVAVKTLKQHRHAVREIPLPPALLRELEQHFNLTARQAGRDREDRLWTFHRTTAWRIVKQVMEVAHLHGRATCPRGLRHAFGVGTLQSGIPLNLVSRWLGHSTLETTAIYTDVVGDEERNWARRYWKSEPRNRPATPSASAPRSSTRQK